MSKYFSENFKEHLQDAIIGEWEAYQKGLKRDLSFVLSPPNSINVYMAGQYWFPINIHNLVSRFLDGGIADNSEWFDEMAEQFEKEAIRLRKHASTLPSEEE